MAHLSWCPLQIRSVRRTIAKITELTKESCNHCNLPKDGRKKEEKRVGVVTSDKMDKSIVVAEVRKVKHPIR
jgi:hypothetical protein